ncbi:MAG: hypothetical protein ACOYM4_20755, partial [Nodosilinea sp.]
GSALLLLKGRSHGLNKCRVNLDTSARDEKVCMPTTLPVLLRFVNNFKEDVEAAVGCGFCAGVLTPLKDGDDLP